MDLKKRYTLAELDAIPTIDSGHFDNMKFDGVVDNVRCQLWVSRMTRADGAARDNEVFIKKYINNEWVTTTTYEPRKK